MLLLGTNQGDTKFDHQYDIYTIQCIFADPLEFTLPLLTKPAHFYRPPDTPPQMLVDMNQKVQYQEDVCYNMVAMTLFSTDS